MRLPLMIGVVVLPVCSIVAAEEPATKIRLAVPDGWKQERISLPPSFAREMQLKGIEEVRFAPGMFDPKSDSFFSYLFVFQVQPKPKLDRDTLRRELLVYYRGLSAAVLKSRKIKVDTEKFAITITADKTAATDKSDPAGMKQYAGVLTWVEPFATRKPQKLHLEIQTWADLKTKQNYLFICVSPKERAAEIWKTMRKLRTAFHRGEQS